MALIMAMRRLLHVVSPLSLSSCSCSSSSSCAAALAATRTPLRSKLCWQQPFLVATTKGQEVCASAGFFTESSSSSPAVFGGCSGVLAAKDSRVSGASFNKGERRRRRRRGAEKRGFGNRSSSSSSSSVMGLGVQQERAVAVEEGMDPVQKRLMFEDE